MTVLGIHTPETPGERDVAAIRQKAKANRLEYPVAVDNGTKNWEAWANRYWPSTYLVDKRGQVRFWWYGELGGPEDSAGKVLEQKIKELLAESD